MSVWRTCYNSTNKNSIGKRVIKLVLGQLSSQFILYKIVHNHCFELCLYVVASWQAVDMKSVCAAVSVKTFICLHEKHFKTVLNSYHMINHVCGFYVFGYT